MASRVTRALLDAHLHTWERARDPQTWIDPTTMALIDRDFSLVQAGEEIAAHDAAGCVVVQAVNTLGETLDLLAASPEPGVLASFTHQDRP